MDFAKLIKAFTDAYSKQSKPQFSEFVKELKIIKDRENLSWEEVCLLYKTFWTTCSSELDPKFMKNFMSSLQGTDLGFDLDGWPPQNFNA